MVHLLVVRAASEGVGEWGSGGVGHLYPAVTILNVMVARDDLNSCFAIRVSNNHRPLAVRQPKDRPNHEVLFHCLHASPVE